MNLIPYKNHEFLIDTCAMLNNENWKVFFLLAMQNLKDMKN